LGGLKNKEYATMVEEYLRRVTERDEVIGVILFGSVAKGEALPFPRSDIDIIVVCRGLPLDLFERAEHVRGVEEAPSMFQSIWMTPTEFEEHIAAKAGHVLDAIHDGLIIFDKEGFLKRKLEDLKKELKRKSVRRINGAWVWPVKEAGQAVEL
jgi:predicted nucleotidyltransferase